METDFDILSMQSDEDLVDQVLEGKVTSYSMLVKKYQRSLTRLAWRMTRDLDVADDVVQESFIKAYEKLSSLQGGKNFRSWIFQITVNTAKNKLRGREGKGVRLEDIDIIVMASEEAKMVNSAISGLIQTVVDALPVKQRTALTLRVYEDMSFKEIAEIMDCPYDTAKANYRHALLKLKESLRKEVNFADWSFETDRSTNVFRLEAEG